MVRIEFPGSVKYKTNGASVELKDIESFFGGRLPDYVKDDFNDHHVISKLDQSDILEAIDFYAPFLRLEKMVILQTDGKTPVPQTRSLGTGMISQDDTQGHYGNSIFLSLCGTLLGQAASIHAAALFPGFVPQVLEASGIKVFLSSFKSVRLWKPSMQGTTFLADTLLIKKKMQIVFVTSKISFGNIQFGVIEVLKLALTPHDSLKLVEEIPPLD